MEIIKLGILYFLSSHGIRAKRENLIFLGDRVSFRSPSPPPDLLLTAAAAAVTAAGDFSGSSSPAENHRFRDARGRSTRRWQPRRQPEAHAPSRAALLRQLAVHAPARVGACLLLRRRDSTHRVVRRRLGVLSLRRSNPSPPPPFGPFCLRRQLQFIFSRFSSSSVGFSSSSVVFSTVWVPFFFIFKLHSRDSPSY